MESIQQVWALVEKAEKIITTTNLTKEISTVFSQKGKQERIYILKRPASNEVNSWTELQEDWELGGGATLQARGDNPRLSAESLACLENWKTRSVTAV